MSVYFLEGMDKVELFKFAVFCAESVMPFCNDDPRAIDVLEASKNLIENYSEDNNAVAKKIANIANDFAEQVREHDIVVSDAIKTAVRVWVVAVKSEKYSYRQRAQWTAECATNVLNISKEELLTRYLIHLLDQALIYGN